MTPHFPEINELLRKVKERYGKPLETSGDYSRLSYHIYEITKNNISESTLKRIFGYVRYQSKPGATTLNILSQYIGYRDFPAFDSGLQKDGITCSRFFHTKSIESKNLKTGSHVEIGWSPARYLKLEYMGDARFLVEKAENSKIRQGDVLYIDLFMLEQPLFARQVLRNGISMDMYLAGKENGIQLLNLI